MIGIPAKIFITVEGWPLLDAIYFILISLTTIGFGDFTPRIDPPPSRAVHVRNETECLFDLIHPFRPAKTNPDTGLSALCNPTYWNTMTRIVYSIYRTAVFFWILMGLTWIGGVVSLVKDNIK